MLSSYILSNALKQLQLNNIQFFLVYLGVIFPLIKKSTLDHSFIDFSYLKSISYEISKMARKLIIK